MWCLWLLQKHWQVKLSAVSRAGIEILLYQARCSVYGWDWNTAISSVVQCLRLGLKYCYTKLGVVYGWDWNTAISSVVQCLRLGLKYCYTQLGVVSTAGIEILLYQARCSVYGWDWNTAIPSVVQCLRLGLKYCYIKFRAWDRNAAVPSLVFCIVYDCNTKLSVV